MTPTHHQTTQIPLFQLRGEGHRTIATTPDINAAITANCAVAIGVSGGKDSAAGAFRTIEYLDAVGHQGARILIHSHLGRVEWRQSLPACERLADRLRLDLVVVRREAGDLLDRWRVRWANNVRRYSDLCCVKLILPWSTASMRFCTSEMKTAIIARDLVRRFPHQTILSVSGIRRQESSRRAVAPVAKVQPKLHSAGFQTSGLDWHPILEWTLSDVLEYLQAKNFPLHDAYARYGSSRVSCVFCVLASRRDLAAAALCEDNHEVYRELVRLEAESTFSFQDSFWLADVAPDLLGTEIKEAVESAKIRARIRETAEAAIPAHLLYESGWPRVIPTPAEAELLCQIRRLVGATVGFAISYVEPQALIQRYVDLIRLRPNR
jgi:3'-phosphoadenosine 5'-phosphosulfate sulfotransferase (PAPS reductase)/FAD synthetase